MSPNRHRRRALSHAALDCCAVENSKWPRTLTVVPCDLWPAIATTVPEDERPVQVWRSMLFICMEFRDCGHQRLTIHRSVLESGGRNWLAGISWDELMAVKDQAGFGDRWAVEVYPPTSQIVNVANMRHLWLLPEPPPYGWRDARAATRADPARATAIAGDGATP